MKLDEPHLALDYARILKDAPKLHVVLLDIARREVPPPDVSALTNANAVCAVVKLERLAKLTNSSTATVKRKLRILFNEGWIVRLNRKPNATAYILGDETGLYSDKIIREKKRRPLKKRIPGRKKSLPKPIEKVNGSQNEPFNGSQNEPLTAQIILNPLLDMDLKKLGVSDSLICSVSNTFSTYKNSEEIEKSKEVIERKISPRKRERKKPLVGDWKNREIREWKSITLWSMIKELLAENMVFTSLQQKEYKRYMSQLKRLLSDRGPEEVKRVAEYFCRNYRKLRDTLGLKGRVTPGVFSWFYNEIRDAAGDNLNIHTHDREYHECEDPSDWKALQ